MRRRNWLLALLGIGAAKAMPDTQHDIEAIAKALQGQKLRSVRPANGQCPVCGTMAEKYSLAEWREGRRKAHEAWLKFYPEFPMAFAFDDIEGETPPARQLRCKTCSAAFFQDAEK
jgi:hypothetical protein